MSNQDPNEIYRVILDSLIAKATDVRRYLDAGDVEEFFLDLAELHDLLKQADLRRQELSRQRRDELTGLDKMREFTAAQWQAIQADNFAEMNKAEMLTRLDGVADMVGAVKATIAAGDAEGFFTNLDLLVTEVGNLDEDV